MDNYENSHEYQSAVARENYSQQVAKDNAREAQERGQKEFEREQDRTRGGSSRTYTDSSWFATGNARILFIIGSILLFLSFTASTKNIFVGGFELSQTCKYLGIGLMVIGKMPQLLLFVIFMYIAYVLFASGRTPTGFQWGAITMKAWLTASFCGIIFYVIKKILVIGKS